VPSRDHKRAFDNDTGPNTGGMGAYTKDDMVSAELEETIQSEVVRPTLRALQEEGIPYRGFLYFGLMLTEEGPKVLEFNCRLGDPETEAILLRADFDLAQACLAAAEGNLGGFHAKWTPGASICVVIASEGYPALPKTGKLVEGLERAGRIHDTVVFHAGTRKDGNSYYTSGGRILDVCTKGADFKSAQMMCYDAISNIKIDGSFYRRDIGRTRAAKAGSDGD
jgi:phosphoribosylamine---glycine ligase